MGTNKQKGAKWRNKTVSGKGDTSSPEPLRHHRREIKPLKNLVRKLRINKQGYVEMCYGDTINGIFQYCRGHGRADIVKYLHLNFALSLS